MRKERINIYITQRQKVQLAKRSQQEDLPMAEIIRRALDVYLAWDDPAYRESLSRLPSLPLERGVSSRS